MGTSTQSLPDSAMTLEIKENLHGETSNFCSYRRLHCIFPTVRYIPASPRSCPPISKTSRAELCSSSRDLIDRPKPIDVRIAQVHRKHFSWMEWPTSGAVSRPLIGDSPLWVIRVCCNNKNRCGTNDSRSIRHASVGSNSLRGI